MESSRKADAVVTRLDDVRDSRKHRALRSTNQADAASSGVGATLTGLLERLAVPTTGLYRTVRFEPSFEGRRPGGVRAVLERIADGWCLSASVRHLDSAFNVSMAFTTEGRYYASCEPVAQDRIWDGAGHLSGRLPPIGLTDAVGYVVSDEAVPDAGLVVYRSIADYLLASEALGTIETGPGCVLAVL